MAKVTDRPLASPLNFIEMGNQVFADIFRQQQLLEEAFDRLVLGKSSDVEVWPQDSNESLKLVTEVAVRSKFLTYTEMGNAFDLAFNAIEVSFKLASLGLAEKNLPLLLIEDAMELCPSWEAHRILQFMQLLSADMNFSSTKGPGLVLLRLTNELIRRVSKAHDSATSGNALLLLSKLFPTGERSGVNLRGDLDIDNVTAIDPAEIDLEGASFDFLDKTLSPFAFYHDFWRLQSHFLHPEQVFTGSNTYAFQKCLDVILDIFEKTPCVKAADSNVAGSAFPKFLSSFKLFSHQLVDFEFRYIFLLQATIWLRWIQWMAGNSEKKEPFQKMTAGRFTPDMDTWILAALKRIDSILYYQCKEDVQARLVYKWILKAEENWNGWKANSCPQFNIPPEEAPIFIAHEPKGRSAALPAGELDRLWAMDEDNSTSGNLPELSAFIDLIRDQADPEERIEPEYRVSADPAYVWRTIRLLNRSIGEKATLGSVRSQETLEQYATSTTAPATE